MSKSGLFITRNLLVRKNYENCGVSAQSWLRYPKTVKMCLSENFQNFNISKCLAQAVLRALSSFLYIDAYPQILNAGSWGSLREFVSVDLKDCFKIFKFNFKETLF